MEAFLGRRQREKTENNMNPIPDDLALRNNKCSEGFRSSLSKSVHLSRLPSISQGLNPMLCSIHLTVELYPAQATMRGLSRVISGSTQGREMRQRHEVSLSKFYFMNILQVVE